MQIWAENPTERNSLISRQRRETMIYTTMSLIFFFKTRLWTCVTWSNFGSGNRTYCNRSLVLCLSAQKTPGGKKRKRKWQSYSQGWKPYNKPHCVSVDRLLFAIFLYKLWRGKKKKRSFYSLSLFPPVDISSQSTDSLANSTPTSFTNSPSSSSFLPSSSSSCWQITLSSGTLFHLATPASLFLPLYFHTNCKPPSFPLQFSNEFHWHGLKKPIHLPLHHLSVFLFSVFLQRALLAPFNDSNSFALSLSLTLVALSLALYCQFKQPLWHSAYKRFNTGWPECVNPNKPGWLKCIAIMKMFFCTLYFLDLRPFLLFKSSLHLFSFVFPRLFLLFYLFLCSFLH